MWSDNPGTVPDDSGDVDRVSPTPVSGTLSARDGGRGSRVETNPSRLGPETENGVATLR